MTRVINNIIWKAVVLIVMLSSCSGIKHVQIQKQLVESNCNQQNAYNYSDQELPRPLYEVSLDAALTNRFSFKSLNVAHAIGALDHLMEYVNLKNTATTDNYDLRLDRMELLQKITQRINISSLEISAVAAEIDCEEERTSQIATYLKGKEDDDESKFTVGSIVVGAVGAIATGVLLVNGNDSDVPEVIAIGAGLAEATLGLMILLGKRKVAFYHPRNALREVWDGREISTIFPSSVWYYLNYYNPQVPEESSLRYQIIDRWMSFGQISSLKSKKKRSLIDVYFGDGGKYTADQLITRADMLDQLESYITLMKQDLKGLAVELESLN